MLSVMMFNTTAHLELFNILIEACGHPITLMSVFSHQADTLHLKVKKSKSILTLVSEADLNSLIKPKTTNS
jgi:hypothetical protein